MNKSFLLALAGLASFAASLHAADRFWRTSNDGTVGASFLDSTNYDNATLQAGDRMVLTGNNVDDTTLIYLDQTAPSLGILEMRDRGATFEIRTGGVLSATTSTYLTDVNQGNFKLAVKGGTLSLEDYNPSGAGAVRHSLEITSGTFNLTGTSALTGLNISTGATVSVSGGTLNLGVNSGALGLFRLANGSATGNLTWTGGTIRGVERFQGDNVTNSTVTNGGGTLFVNNNIRTDDLVSYNNGTGSIVFGINSDGTSSAQLSQYTGGSAWNLTTGTVAVDFGSYTPMAGNSWDFTSLTAGPSGFLASASNIASLSADGQWIVTWNTSNWTSGGVLSIDSVSPVPEPATVAFILSGLILAFAGYRRARQ